MAAWTQGILDPTPGSVHQVNCLLVEFPCGMKASKYLEKGFQGIGPKKLVFLICNLTIKIFLIHILYLDYLEPLNLTFQINANP